MKQTCTEPFFYQVISQIRHLKEYFTKRFKKGILIIHLSILALFLIPVCSDAQSRKDQIAQLNQKTDSLRVVLQIEKGKTDSLRVVLQIEKVKSDSLINVVLNKEQQLKQTNGELVNTQKRALSLESELAIENLLRKKDKEELSGKIATLENKESILLSKIDSINTELKINQEKLDETIVENDKIKEKINTYSKLNTQMDNGSLHPNLESLVSNNEKPLTTVKPQELEKVLPKPIAKPEILTSSKIFGIAEQAFEKKNYVEAINYYEQAANVGNSEAMNALGYMYQTGTGVTKDTKQAKILYEQSYSKSNQKGAYKLGYTYEFGLGIPVDLLKAKGYYQKACDWGDDNGCERVKYLNKSEEPKVPIIETRKFKDLPFTEMAYIPGGTFRMGDTRNEGNGNEKPVHTVRLNGFYMGKYEVTQRQWVSIMNYNPSQLYDCLDCPVENVNWNDVQIFLKKLNSRTGSIYRLPTEAEWEYAAGGGSNNRTRFGNGMDILESSGANFDASEFVEGYSRAGEYRGKTTRVGSFQPNGLGLYDMSGNVLEWCSDAHEYNSSYSHESSVNPTGPANGDSRIVRGGSWNRHAQSCRVTVRYPHRSGYRIYDCGFRLVMSQ